VHLFLVILGRKGIVENIEITNNWSTHPLYSDHSYFTADFSGRRWHGVDHLMKVCDYMLETQTGDSPSIRGSPGKTGAQQSSSSHFTGAES